MRATAKALFGVLALVGLGAAHATGAADEDPMGRLGERLRAVLPDAEITAVRPGPIPGLVEVALGPRILYASADGRYVLNGDLWDLEARRNLTEERRAAARIDAFLASGLDKMIEFGPDDPKHVIYVFTDIDCAYCRRMHSEIRRINAAGIAVRYLAFPRAGPGSESFRKAVSVWCAKDRRRALTDAKAGREIPEASCDSPVEEHYRLGLAMGVRGTPTVITETGEELGGYIPVEQLVRILDGGS